APNGPYFMVGSFHSGTRTLKPGDELVRRWLLNQCVAFEKPGVYVVWREDYVALPGGEEGSKTRRRLVKARPARLHVKAFAPGRRKPAIEPLTAASRDNSELPADLASALDGHYGGRLDVVRLLALFREPALIPLFLDVIAAGDTNGFAFTALVAMPDRKAV